MFGSLLLIAVVVGAGAAFAYTAGWFSPQRLTPEKIVAALAPPTGAALGHRRNHAKGICFIGVLGANGAGSALSTAQVFTRGQYPVLGRFNLATADANAPDATVRVRGMGLQIATPDGEAWRSAMIDAPIFPVSTPQAFYELLIASASKDPDAMKTFAGAHPEIAAFGAWAKSAIWTGSADAGDPTADPSKAWPENRRVIEVGTLTVQQIEAERDGPCRDINFDPTVLPSGMRTSDDPFPAARSAAYARSYDLRTAEAKDYPRTATDAKP
jgi:catalase